MLCRANEGLASDLRSASGRLSDDFVYDVDKFVNF
jgi:hypothetical protein